MMGRILGLAGVVLVAVGAWGVGAWGDEVYLADGSKLMGTVQGFVDGQFTMMTEFAGEVRAPVTAVMGLTTTRRWVVLFEGGDQVTGRLLYEGGAQRLVETAFGEIRVDPGKIRGMWAPGAPDLLVVRRVEEETAALQEAHEETISQMREDHEAALQAVEERVPRVGELWSGRFELGLTGQSGNKDRLDIRGRAEARRESKVDRLVLYVQGQYAESNKQRSANEVLGGARLEVDISRKWFAFGKIELEYDEFERLDLRSTVSAGAGYFFIREDRHELKGRLGIGYLHETFEAPRRADPPALTIEERFRQALRQARQDRDELDAVSVDDVIVELGYDYRLDVKEWFRFTHQLTYYPAFEDLARDYRVTSDVAAEFPLTRGQDWRLRLGMRNDYDNRPRPDVDKLDTSYYLNLVYDW